MTGNVRDSRTTHPKKRARQQRALDRFVVGETTNAAYQQRKATELASLKKSLGVA